VSILSEENTNYYLVCEVIDAGEPKLKQKDIKDLLKVPEGKNAENSAANLSNLKLIITSLGGKMIIKASNYLTTFGIAF